MPRSGEIFVALLKFRTTAFERQTEDLNSALADPEQAKGLLAPRVEVVPKQPGYDGSQLSK